ncbi:UNVERIFIED_CONTAM: hypothetical protein NCL1_32487 [Trichonephila clavipes]
MNKPTSKLRISKFLVEPLNRGLSYIQGYADYPPYLPHNSNCKATRGVVLFLRCSNPIRKKDLR